MKRIAVLFLLMFPATSWSIDENQTGAWYSFIYSKSFLDSRWGLKGDWQYRKWDLDGDLQTFLIRNAVTYTINDNWTAAAGYAHLTRGEFGASDRKNTEHRTYQEIVYRHQAGDLSVSHRLRTEQRWIQNRSRTERYRYNLSIQYPLTDRWYLSGYNEYFVNAGGKFDQNRTKAALGYRVNAQNRIHAGYMYQVDNDFEKGQVMLSWYLDF
jgi:hypothetical protein